MLIYLPKLETMNLDARGKLAIFVGYAETSKAYKFLVHETHKVVVSRDVSLYEKSAVGFDPEITLTEFDLSNDYVGSDRESFVGHNMEESELGSENSSHEERQVEKETGNQEDARFKVMKWRMGTRTSRTAETVCPNNLKCHVDFCVLEL